MGNKAKRVALATLIGTMAMFGGCINWADALWATAVASAIEFVTDNNGIFDLFPDG